MRDQFIAREQAESFVVLAWALDFLRALNSRPLLMRWIARLAMGRYAWNELNGLRNALEDNGYDPTTLYDLEEMSYHRRGRK